MLCLLTFPELRSRDMISRLSPTELQSTEILCFSERRSCVLSGHWEWTVWSLGVGVCRVVGSGVCEVIGSGVCGVIEREDCESRWSDPLFLCNKTVRCKYFKIENFLVSAFLFFFNGACCLKL